MTDPRTLETKSFTNSRLTLIGLRDGLEMLEKDREKLEIEYSDPAMSSSVLFDADVLMLNGHLTAILAIAYEYELYDV